MIQLHTARPDTNKPLQKPSNAVNMWLQQHLQPSTNSKHTHANAWSQTKTASERLQAPNAPTLAMRLKAQFTTNTNRSYLC